jgi:hypothetical protein
MLGPDDSGKGDSNCSTSDRIRPLKLADAVIERVHLEPAPIHNHDRFLVTRRNPIDRIVSWYYYAHPNFPPKKLARHRRACQNYVLFDNCYRSIQDLTEDGLCSAAEDNDEPRNDEQHGVYRNIARSQIAGKPSCKHDAYNYSFTYGSLLEVGRSQSQHGDTPKQQQRQRDAEPTTAPADHDHDDGGSSSSNPKQSITMYAILSEHLERDWPTTRRRSNSHGHGGRPIGPGQKRLERPGTVCPQHDPIDERQNQPLPGPVPRDSNLQEALAPGRQFQHRRCGTIAGRTGHHLPGRASRSDR